MPPASKSLPSVEFNRCARLSEEELREFVYAWALHAAEKQWRPPGDWTTWLLMGGRGSGKTRAGAEWVRQLVEDEVSPIAIVGETMTIEGGVRGAAEIAARLLRATFGDA